MQVDCLIMDAALGVTLDTPVEKTDKAVPETYWLYFSNAGRKWRCVTDSQTKQDTSFHRQLTTVL